MCCPVPAPGWFLSGVWLQTYAYAIPQDSSTWDIPVMKSRIFEIGTVLEFPEIWWPMSMEGNVVSIRSVSYSLPRLPPFHPNPLL